MLQERDSVGTAETKPCQLNIRVFESSPDLLRKIYVCVHVIVNSISYLLGSCHKLTTGLDLVGWMNLIKIMALEMQLVQKSPGTIAEE